VLIYNPVDRLAMDRKIRRCAEAQLYPVALYLQNGHGDLVSDTRKPSALAQE
jgi:hypothetical protein